MRLLLALAVMVLGAGCVGPHSTGALWALQNAQLERERFQKTDAQRAAAAHDFELSLADESLAVERSRVQSQLVECPGPRAALGASSGDIVRDAIRFRAQGDTPRLSAAANIALADWYARRASATGEATFCDRAREALARENTPAQPGALNQQPQAASGAPTPTPQTRDQGLLARLPAATVSRDPHVQASTGDLDTQPPLVTLSNYVLGYVDTVHAASPLPQYLALVYGGSLVLPADAPSPPSDESAANLVDAQAANYPDWEPDALYAALRGATR